MKFLPKSFDKVEVKVYILFELTEEAHHSPNYHKPVITYVLWQALQWDWDWN